MPGSNEIDTIFLGANIVDGSGTRPAYQANVHVRDGGVTSIDESGGLGYKHGRIIDCQNGR